MTTHSTTTFRIFLRGETVTFAVHFYADAAGTIPLIPLDVAQYPAFSIYSPDNQVVQSGVGQPEITPGRYKTTFLIQKDALLSNDLGRWRIEWTIVSVDQRQVDFVEEFDVRDDVITATESKEISFTTLAGATYRATLRLPEQPTEVVLDMYVSSTTNTPVLNNITEGIGGIQKTTDGDSIVYYYDVDGSKLGCNMVYNLLWKVRETTFSPQQFIFQVLTAVTPNVLGGITSLRHLMDKLMKRSGVVQSYEDSHLLEYLVKGHQLVNSTYPTTYFAFGMMPPLFDVFHTLYSAWYGLQAQTLLAGELAFSFSGQTVTLDFDHTSVYSDMASKWNDFIEKNLPPAKMSYVRKSQAIGAVGGRVTRFSQINFTYSIGSYRGFGGGNMIATLNHLGLLF